VTIVETGLTELDKALGDGFRTRGVHLVCAKTGQAKSQLAVAVAVNAARRGIPVGFLSLELGADEIAQLVAASLSGVPRWALARGKVGGPWGEKLKSVKQEHSKLPLFVLDYERWPGGLDRDGLAALAAEGVKRFGWRLIVLDYLGLLAAPEADQFQSDVLNSTALRKLARANDVALLVVAALRKSQATTFKKPETVQLDDVAGAGRLVYDATSVLFVWCEPGDDDTGLVHVRPLKLRYAALKENADVQLRWYPKTGRIEDLPTGDEEKKKSGA
jgi:replicative DNA helicase